MARKIITEALGTTWKVDENLIDAEGLEFVLDYLKGYDLSLLEFVSVHYGDYRADYEKAMPEDEESDEEYYYDVQSAFHGKHKFMKTKLDDHNCVYRRECRINCTVNGRVTYPACDDRTAHTRFGKRKIPFYVYSEDESVVAVVAHEVAHHLGYTGQIPANGKPYSGYRHRDGHFVPLTDPGGVPFTIRSCDEVEAGEFMKAAVEAFRVRNRDAIASPQPVTDAVTEGSVTDAVTADPEKRCVNCGRVLLGRRTRFCSDECRRADFIKSRRAAGEADRRKICEVCGKGFTASRRDAKTCSAACRQRLRRMHR